MLNSFKKIDFRPGLALLIFLGFLLFVINLFLLIFLQKFERLFDNQYRVKTEEALNEISHIYSTSCSNIFDLPITTSWYLLDEETQKKIHSEVLVKQNQYKLKSTFLYDLKNNCIDVVGESNREVIAAAIGYFSLYPAEKSNQIVEMKLLDAQAFAGIKQIDRSSYVAVLLGEKSFYEYNNLRTGGGRIIYIYVLAYSLFILTAVLLGSLFYRQSKRKLIADAESLHLKEVGLMAAEVAHSIKNPVQIISLQAESSNDKELSKEIRYECMRIEKMIDDFLSLTREIVIQKENLNETLLKELLSKSTKGFPALEIKISIQPSDYLLDTPHLLEIFENLLSNSDRFQSGANPTVYIEITKRHGKVKVLYEDNGVGFGDKDTKTLFQPFVTTSTKGTGLGLSKVKRIVMSWGGKVIAENRGNGGAKFLLRFPG